MTANVVIPGMTTVGGDDLPIAGPALALADFIGVSIASSSTKRIVNSCFEYP